MPTKSLKPDEALDIAVDACVYGSPLVMMEYHRRVMTNAESQPAATSTRGPINQFTHLRAFPDPSERDVVAPNSDTLYSSCWFDVSQEPLVIGAPDSTGQYYLLPMLDAWTGVFASPGTRTTGSSSIAFAVAGPGWSGRLPEGVQLIQSPTSFGWILGRTRSSRETYAETNRFQDQLQAVPLSQWGRPYTPPKSKVDASVNMKDPPVSQVRQLGASEFWTTFFDLWTANPPHANDYPILHQMERIGLRFGDRIAFDGLPAATRDALTRAVAIAQRRIDEMFPRLGVAVNGWRMTGSPVGTWATAYLIRAVAAWWGIGANVPEDAAYPLAFADSEGQPLDSARRYSIRFEKEQLPPAKAFWSLTMYDGDMFYAPNPIHRYALGDRDRLTYQADGSLELYLQRESPGKNKESNWLPTPASGKFIAVLRLYCPKQEVLEGRWHPPAVRRMESVRGAGG